jgi:hypothetical protein
VRIIARLVLLYELGLRTAVEDIVFCVCVFEIYSKLVQCSRSDLQTICSIIQKNLVMLNVTESVVCCFRRGVSEPCQSEHHSPQGFHGPPVSLMVRTLIKRNPYTDLPPLLTRQSHERCITH